MEDIGKEPMTYRQIKEYVEASELDLGSMDWEDISVMPWGVFRWLTHEVLHTIRKTGSYQWPETLDITCEFTALQTGRYITEPRDETRLSSSMPM